MKRLLMRAVVVWTILAAGCAPKAPPATAPPPPPSAPTAKSKPPQPKLLGVAPRAASPVGIAPTPSAPTVQQTSETVAPTDVVGVAFCAVVSSGWNANRWYVTYIDTVQQPWPGALIPQPGDASGLCYQTDKKFQFAEGTHTLEVGLVNHCEPGDPDTACQQCALANGGATCGESISGKTAITVVSTTAPATCTVTTTPATATVPVSGGTGTITVTASDPSCTWVASTDVTPWLTISPTSGSGSGAVSYTVPATTAGPRSGNVLIAGQKTFITQTGAPCGFTISPTSWAAPANGGMSSITVTLTAGGGCPWSAASSAAWVSITAVTGTDTGNVQFTVNNNPDQAARSAKIVVTGDSAGDKAFDVTQAGTMTDQCAAGQPQAPTITYLRTMPSNPKAAQPMNPQYQLSSASPITNIIVRMNGTLVGQVGPGITALTAESGQWFNAPARGTYVMTIEVVNALGCHRTSGNIGVTIR